MTEPEVTCTRSIIYQKLATTLRSLFFLFLIFCLGMFGMINHITVFLLQPAPTPSTAIKSSVASASPQTCQPLIAVVDTDNTPPPARP
jgi:hypothetical protein